VLVEELVVAELVGGDLAQICFRTGSSVASLSAL
jgi:hypothetical protein